MKCLEIFKHDSRIWCGMDITHLLSSRDLSSHDKKNKNICKTIFRIRADDSERTGVRQECIEF